MSDPGPAPAAEPRDGVLLSVAQAKRYIRGLEEHDADDVLLGDLIEEAEGELEGYIGCFLVAAETVQVFDGGKPYIRLRNLPLKPNAPFEVRDLRDGVSAAEVLQSGAYRVDRFGHLEYGRGTYDWPAGGGRYEVRYTGGLDQRPDWERVVKPRLRKTIRDLVADWYENRNPSATTDSSGVGVSIVKPVRQIPEGILETWNDYRPLIP